MGQEELSVPTGDEELVHELWSRLRDCSGRLPFILPRHGQGPEDVPPVLQLVAASPSLLPAHLLLRRDQEVLAQEKSRRMDRKRDLLLVSVVGTYDLLLGTHSSLLL